MHWENILIVRRSKLIVCFLLTSLLVSCHSFLGEKGDGVSEKQEKDSIIYVLGDNATSIIIDSLIKDKEVCYCSILSNVNNNEYSFSFPFNTCSEILSNRTKLLLRKTNHFINLKGKILPVLFMEDELFTDIRKDSMHYIQDYNFATIKVTAKSEIIDYHSW